MEDRATCDAATMTRFEWSIRALAQNSEAQLVLYPSYACCAEELALEFDETKRALTDEDLATLTPEELDSVQRIDALLESFSGPEHEEKWTDEALGAAPEWEAVREAARSLIHLMGWPDDPPPVDRAIYVGPDS